MLRLPRVLLAAQVSLLAVSALTGCARFYWVKPGSTEEQFARDSQACEAEESSSPAAARSVEENVYRRCLMDRGYVRQELAIPGPDAHRGVEKRDQP